MPSLGTSTTSTQSIKQLFTGDHEILPLPIKLGATPAIGQVYVWENSSKSWKDFTAFSAGNILAINADRHSDSSTVLAAAAVLNCCVKGHVNLTKLDAVAKVDASIIPALLENGIIARTPVGA